MILDRWLETPQARIHYAEAGGGGKTIVLLHGAVVDWSGLSWKYALSRLGRSHRVLAPDWPGYGMSSPMRGAYTTEALATCLGDMLRQWEVDRVTLVGLSMGGAVALGYALEHPSAVDRLVLVDSYGLHDRSPYHPLGRALRPLAGALGYGFSIARRYRAFARLALWKVVNDPDARTAELLDEVYRALQFPTAWDAFRSWIETELRWRGVRTCYRDALPRLAAPTLLVHGERDSVVPVRAAKLAHERIPHARLEVVPNCGHWPPREAPEFFFRIVDDFLGTD